jgi:hypothetical protein
MRTSTKPALTSNFQFGRAQLQRPHLSIPTFANAAGLTFRGGIGRVLSLLLMLLVLVAPLRAEGPQAMIDLNGRWTDAEGHKWLITHEPLNAAADDPDGSLGRIQFELIRKWGYRTIFEGHFRDRETIEASHRMVHPDTLNPGIPLRIRTILTSSQDRSYEGAEGKPHTYDLKLSVKIDDRGATTLEGVWEGSKVTWDRDDLTVSRVFRGYSHPVTLRQVRSPIAFVKWSNFEDRPVDGVNRHVGVSFTETEDLVTSVPFAVEARVDTPPSREGVPLIVEVGERRLTSIAMPTKDRGVYRTPSFVLTSEGLEAERESLRSARLGWEDSVDKWNEQAERLKQEDAFPDQVMHAVGFREEAKRRVKDLKLKCLIEFGQAYEHLDRFAIEDGDIITATFGDDSAQAACRVFDYSVANVDVQVFKPEKYARPGATEAEMRKREDGDKVNVYRGDRVDVVVSLLRHGSGLGEPVSVGLAVPFKGVIIEKEVLPVPDIPVGGVGQVRFSFTFENYLETYESLAQTLPCYAEAKELEAIAHPMPIICNLLSGANSQYLTDSIGANNFHQSVVFFRNEPLEDMIAHLKLEAKRDARQNKHKRTMAGTKFERYVRTVLLADYFRNPSRETARQAMRAIGRKATRDECKTRWGRFWGWQFGRFADSVEKWTFLPWVDLYVPDGLRSHYPSISNLSWIEPASVYFSDRPPFGCIDGPYVMSNVGVSSTMHWATAVRYSPMIREDIFRELFLGYEMQHMEGWDIFGDDPINDLIAEEAGRLLGRMLFEGRLTQESEVTYALDESFQEATAWVGAMMKVRVAELDRLVRSEKEPLSNKWWEDEAHFMPWEGNRTIIAEMRRGLDPFEIKRDSKLVKALTRTYRVIYDSDEWHKQGAGPIVLTPITMNMLRGQYDHQFARCTKIWGLAWEFDPKDSR